MINFSFKIMSFRRKWYDMLFQALKGKTANPEILYSEIIKKEIKAMFPMKENK